MIFDWLVRISALTGHLDWGYLVATVFRRGSQRSNCSDTVVKALVDLIKLIRTNFREDSD